MITKKSIVVIVLMLALLSWGCSSEKDVLYSINANGGLNMRSTASIKGKRVGLLPDRALVRIIKKEKKQQTIGGRNGRWVYVIWKDKKGWVFDAFLEKKVIDDKASAKKWQKFTTMELHCSDSGAPFMDYDQVEYSIKLKNGAAAYKSVSSATVGSTTVRQKGSYAVSGNMIRITLQVGTTVAVTQAQTTTRNRSTALAKTITLHWKSKADGFVPADRMKYLNNSKYVVDAKDGYFITKADQKTREQGQFEQLGFYRIKKMRK